MLTRRDILRAAAVPGLASAAGAAMAQQQPKRKASTRKKASNDPVPVQADERLSEILAPVRDTNHLPGLIGAILKGGRIAAIGAVGIRKIGSPQPMQVNDQVHIGSCTKAMTATMIGMLVDEGRLTWGSTIGEVFPDQVEQIHPDLQRVTLSHLLTHRAGLPHDVPWWRLPGRTPTEQRLSILMAWLMDPPRHRPGSTYEYLQCRLCPGRADGRAGHRSVVGASDEGTALRPARDGVGGVWVAGTARYRRRTLGPSCEPGPGRADAAG